MNSQTPIEIEHHFKTLTTELNSPATKPKRKKELKRTIDHWLDEYNKEKAEQPLTK